MKTGAAMGAAVAIGTFFALLLAASVWRVEVRHSAPYGFSKTIDFERLIAVPGGYVTANYPNFDRIDLDLRAYDVAATYDLTIHIRPAIAGAADVRTIGLDLSGSKIPYAKGAFFDPFVTVRFPPIVDSRNQTYYVWVERGPRNRNDVVTVWSIKSYSSVPARAVLDASLRRIGPAWGATELEPIAVVAASCSIVFGALAGARLAERGWNATLEHTTDHEP